MMIHIVFIVFIVFSHTLGDLTIGNTLTLSYSLAPALSPFTHCYALVRLLLASW